MNFDVVIIGGGPAGVSAGISLAQNGVSVALLERAIYPYEKTCAGILTEKTVQLLEKEFAINLNDFYSTNNISLFFKEESVCRFSSGYPFILVDRKALNTVLIRACIKAGVRLLDGAEVISLTPETNKLTLKNGSIISYQALIAADGVHSYVRRSLKLDDFQLGFCIQDYIVRSKCPSSLINLQEIQLYFGNIQFGYSWIIPNKTHFVIGSGMFVKDFHWPTMQHKHNQLCAQIGISDKSVRRGAHVPVGIPVDQKIHPYENIVLIGDAAGLANPLTGEGIYLALASGILASQSYQNNHSQFRTTFLSMLEPLTDSLMEQTQLFDQFYNEKLLGSLIKQFKDCPEYLAGICDETISLEKRSYSSALSEIKALLR